MVLQSLGAGLDHRIASIVLQLLCFIAIGGD